MRERTYPYLSERHSYRRDVWGHLTTDEFNRHLPFMACLVCGEWIHVQRKHTIEDCRKRVQIPVSPSGKERGE